jgi:hypothetical protein
MNRFIIIFGVAKIPEIDFINPSGGWWFATLNCQRKWKIGSV